MNAADPIPRAECAICPTRCKLRPGQVGICGARVAEGDIVIDQNYGRITSLALDPIEKKPLAMYMPGAVILSVGSYGCNLRCPFCQNSSIACATADSVQWRHIAPEELVETAKELQGRGNIGIAYTYNEPLVGFEFVLDASRLIREEGMKNVLVSNGYVNEEPLKELLPLIDAANIDLKSFDLAFYKSIGGDLDAVMRTIELMAKSPHCHLEVTTLVVPGVSDDAKLMDSMACWLASLDPDIPYHLSRFFPCHEMAGASPTPVETLKDMEAIARKRLFNVFLGNV